MQANHPDRSSDRLDRLEAEYRQMVRRVRSLKAAVAALGLVLLVPLAMGAFDVPGVIEARQFIVVDPQTNKPRTTIGANPQNGNAYVLIEDAEGNDHIQLVSDWKGERDELICFNTDGKAKVQIGVNGAQQGLIIDGKNVP